MDEERVKHAIWELKLPGILDENLETEIINLKRATEEGFRAQSPNSKQKLVYDLLEAAKNRDQNRFFYLLLKSINKPKEREFKKLWEELEKCYDVLPEEAFINFAYSIIIGIMSTYSNKNGGEKENE